MEMADESRSSFLKADRPKGESMATSQGGKKAPGSSTHFLSSRILFLLQASFNPLSRRFHVLLLIMLGYFALVYMRTNLGLAMTCMTNTTALTLRAAERKEAERMKADLSEAEREAALKRDAYRNETIALGCGADKQLSNTSLIVNDYGGSLEWDLEVQGLLFSASFYGSLVSLIPCGVLVDRYSPRILLQIAAIIAILCTILLPYLATAWGAHAVFASRFLLGVGEGLILPSINKMVSMWIPTHELSTAASVYTNGNQMAGFVGIPLAAVLCGSVFRWPSIFYVCSIIGIVWLIVWNLTITDTPEKCRVMLKAERAYLNEHLQHNGNDKKAATKKPPIPYKAMLTSLPLWSLLMCTFSANMIVVLIQVYLPLFFKEVLLLGQVENGLFSAAPNVCQLLMKMLWATTMDKLKRKRLSNTAACKISQAFSSVTVGALFVLLAFVGRCDRPIWSLLILCSITMCFSIAISGFYTSLLSLAPQYTGTLTSIAMMSGHLGRLVTPKIVPLFNKSGTMAEWSMVFYFMSATTLCSGIFFLCCSGRVRNPQKWSRAEEEPPEIRIEEAKSLEQSVEMLGELETMRRLRRESHVGSVVLDLLD
ncbi:MFS domain-containing protein [Aphelenchoides fujianensis]|nr:MFS domain-containing protein [Aphelenchoides fujianensis]